jgi:CBS domain containing-hemolysin-like protein
MVVLVVTVLLTLGLSFLCSLSEAALYAVPVTRVETLRQAGSSLGVRLAGLRERVERPITAILTLNTFANTMGAAIAGSLFAGLFGARFVIVFSLALTIVILIFSEIVPKSIGVAFSRTLAPWLAWPIQVMVWALLPLVWLGEQLARLISPRRQIPGPSEDEIIALAMLSARGGGILAKEAHWVRHVLRLNDVTAGDIMTPRPVMQTLEGGRTVGELAGDLQALGYSRLPVTTADGPDHITGIVMRRRIVNAFLEGERERTVAELQQPASFVPATTRGHQLLDLFIRQKSHLAIVVDEYGGTMGVVTLEDVIEAMLGEEIVGEFDEHADLRDYARKRAAARIKPRGDAGRS